MDAIVRKICKMCMMKGNLQGIFPKETATAIASINQQLHGATKLE